MSVVLGSLREKSRDLSSQISPEDLKLILNRIEILKKNWNLSTKEIISLFSSPNKEAIPPTIFLRSISPLGAIVKYMHEALLMDFFSISSKLGRTTTVLKNAYKTANERHPKKFSISTHRYMIPISFFGHQKLSILEASAIFLLDKHNLRYAEIAKLLNRDARTIWTVCKRAREKMGEYR